MVGFSLLCGIQKYRGHHFAQFEASSTQMHMNDENYHNKQIHVLFKFGGQNTLVIAITTKSWSLEVTIVTYQTMILPHTTR